jgi:hypothetical protein
VRWQNCYVMPVICLCLFWSMYEYMKTEIKHIKHSYTFLWPLCMYT